MKSLINEEQLEEILYDGSEEEILSASCPVCGGALEISAYEHGLKRKCLKCFDMSIEYSRYKPNSADITPQPFITKPKQIQA